MFIYFVPQCFNQESPNLVCWCKGLDFMVWNQNQKYLEWNLVSSLFHQIISNQFPSGHRYNLFLLLPIHYLILRQEDWIISFLPILFIFNFIKTNFISYEVKLLKMIEVLLFLHGFIFSLYFYFFRKQLKYLVFGFPELMKYLFVSIILLWL